jgi:hypothetical protein
VPVGLDDPLAKRFRLSEQVLRVRGLVGRDEHEAGRAVLDGDVGDHARSQRVVAHGLERIRLQECDVLVRGRVEDDLRPVALEDLAHLGPVAAVAQNRGGGREVTLADELALDVEEGSLGLLDEHDPGRAHPGDLTAELRADRPARARDENGLTGEVLGDRADVHLDRLPAENVLDLDGTDLPGEVQVAGDQLVEARQRLHGDVRVLGHLDDALACLT